MTLSLVKNSVLDVLWDMGIDSIRGDTVGGGKGNAYDWNASGASAVYSPSNLDENEYPGEKTRSSSRGMQHRPNSSFELAPSEDRVYVCAWCPVMDAILG
jgi:hypothetical protein